MKRLVTIQDISCFGRCSSTVALPIISALGIETIILPTAILSTHTGEFENYSFLPLTDEMHKIINHWKELEITFDAIYVGYIGTIEQIDTVCDFIDYFKGENTKVFVDPAMADNEKLYQGLETGYVEAIKKLCKKADIIAPNIYEAMFLCGENNKKGHTYKEAMDILLPLSSLCDKVIITGIHKDDGIVTLGYDKNTETITKKVNSKVEGMYYGTGDIFSSVFIGTYINNIPFDECINKAVEFVEEAIKNTVDEKEKYWYGINFEKCLNSLTRYYKEKEQHF